MKFPEIAAEIIEMVRVDQDMRERNLREPEYWDPDVDMASTRQMKKIVNEIGWPTTSKVGGKASEGAWLLVQHADHDVEFQMHCLELMKLESIIEVLPRAIAYLEDRVRVNRMQPQLYGTQFIQVDGRHVPQHIHDPENVDARRRSMGLGSLEEGIARMYEKYKV